MASDIAGSWFPTGFYGHFRSRSRNDFVCEYRQLAKPQPPEKFYRRSKQPITGHVFSHHDNRHSFLNSALYFEEGLGRKRVPNSTYNSNPEFISWMPEREYVARMRPLHSTYNIDFRRGKVAPQLIVNRPQTSFVESATTTYRYAHGKDSPYREVINAMNNEALMTTAASRIARPKSVRPPVRDTVASCLNWYVPEPPTKPQVPAATATVKRNMAWEPQPSEQELSPPVETVQEVTPKAPSPPTTEPVSVE